MKTCLLLVLLCVTCSVAAQQLVTRNGYIGFYSKTPLEDIKAESNQVNAVLDVGKQSIAFAVLMKGFLFGRKLMQEHFNENYIESDKYPKATFSGTYTGNLHLVKNGTYPVRVKGNLTLHGVTRAIDVPALFQVQAGKVSGKANFAVKPKDFDIEIPLLVREKIAQEIAVTVHVDFNL